MLIYVLFSHNGTYNKIQIVQRLLMPRLRIHIYNVKFVSRSNQLKLCRLSFFRFEFLGDDFILHYRFEIETIFERKTTEIYRNFDLSVIA